MQVVEAVQPHLNVEDQQAQVGHLLKVLGKGHKGLDRVGLQLGEAAGGGQAITGVLELTYDRVKIDI